ncbi:MAG TPA: TIM-barrel domain-containing protein, partial [bacterium]
MPKKSICYVLLVSLLLSPLSSALGKTKTEEVEKSQNGIIFNQSDGFLDIEFLSDSIVRVAFSKEMEFFTRKTIDVVDHPGAGVNWTLKTTPKTWDLHTKELTLSVDRSKGTVKFLDTKGLPILAEADGGRLLEPTEVQGEKVFHVRQQWKPNPQESLYGLGQQQFGILDLKGYDLDLWQHNTNVVVPFLVSSTGYGILWDNTSFSRFGDLREFGPIPAKLLLDKTGKPGGLTIEPMDDSAPATQSATLEVDFHEGSGLPRPTDTRWKGSLVAPFTGDYQFDCVSNGGIKVWMDNRLVMDHWRQGWLVDHDRTKIHLITGHRYPLKIEWSTEQGTTLKFLWKTPSTEKNTSLWSEVGDGTDYTFVYGPSLDKIVAGYRFLTGHAPLMPSWAFGLWQSRQRYETAQQSLDVVDGFRKRKIPFDNIVQDWQYWRPDSWGSHQFDPKRFPNPEGWLKSLHEKHAHVMLSVWGKFYPGSKNFEDMRAKGYLYEPNLKEGMKDWLGHPYSF